MAISKKIQKKVKHNHALALELYATGNGVKPLLEKSKAIATNIGKVEVEMGGTACKVPSAPDYIAKVENMNRIGKKRKTAFC